MQTTTDVILKQIDAVLSRYRDLRRNSKYDDCSDHPKDTRTELLTLMCATIERFAEVKSHYVKSMRETLERLGDPVSSHHLPHIAGILQALRTAHENGYLVLVSELIHAEIFDDFLEMAEYLLSGSYKDAAAVIVGSVLEEHLRKLSAKHGIDCKEANGKPKKADSLNSDLAGQTVYSKLDQKSVTAWLAVRNNAAHGNYSAYQKEQVEMMLQGVRNFLTRVPV